MTYEQAIRFWFGRINYEQRSPRPSDLKLGRMRALLALLGNPEQRLRIVHVAGSIGVTFFEIATAVGLLHFVRRRVEAAILEVGLGGRFDATNVCLPLVAVLTSISYDHTQQLGNTLAAIAREKAGIVKRGRPT